MRKPQVGQVWRVCDGGGLWMNVVLVDYKTNNVGASWIARELATWRQRSFTQERWNPEAPQSKLTGFCSEDPEFYSPFLPDTLPSTRPKKMKKRRTPLPPAPPPPTVKEILEELRGKLPRYALQRLRAGKATFNVWRGTTPWNRWVEGPRGAQLWHSGDDERGPSLLAFELLEESKDRVAHHWIHGDGGQPFHSTYVLKPEYRL